MSIIKVASNSPTSSVAGAIAGTMRENNQAEVQAIGAGAVNQAIKATIMAKRFLAEEGTFVVFSPSFTTVEIRGQERTAIRLTVIPAMTPPADLFSEYIPHGINGRNALGETPLDRAALDADADAIRDEAERYTAEDEIAADFAERQDLAYSGRDALRDKLEEHNAESPVLSGGDVDAAWDDADVGEETVGGMAPTPDQDVVDELGEAMGITYEDDEPLHTGEKLAERDRNRWELDPESAEEGRERHRS